MNRNGINANVLQQRQVLGGILSDVFGGAETVVSQVGGGVSSAIGGVTSAAGGVLTPPPPTSTPPATRTSASTTPLSTISPSSLSSASSSSSTSAPVPASVSTSLSETTSDGVKQTVTAFVTNAVSTPTSTPTNKSFLQNKPLSGFVFALCGVVGLILIILITTFALRRRGRKKLENEAISYDPSIGRGSYHDDMETRLVSEKASIEPRSSLSHNGGAGTSYAPNPHVMYYDQGRTPAYGQQYPNYSSRSPNLFDQQPEYGTNYNNTVGAPVPPRFPNLAYDPERYSSELYRSSSRGSGNSVSPPPPAQPQVPVSLLSGANLKSPPPAAVRPPIPPQLPPVFGDNGSVDERQGVSPIDLKIANQ